MLTVTRIDAIRHYLNPMHVYCRLVDIFGRKHKAMARRVCRVYEQIIYKPILG